MPRKPKTPCNHPLCPRKSVDGESYCEEHLRERKRKAYRDYDKHRGTAKERGYGGSWRRLRKIVLSKEPLCRHCNEGARLTPATEVDHIDGDTTNNSLDNLQPLCKSCHSKKTVREQGGVPH